MLFYKHFEMQTHSPNINRTRNALPVKMQNRIEIIGIAFFVRPGDFTSHFSHQGSAIAHTLNSFGKHYLVILTDGSFFFQPKRFNVLADYCNVTFKLSFSFWQTRFVFYFSINPA